MNSKKNPPVECLSGTRPGAPRRLDPKIHLIDRQHAHELEKNDWNPRERDLTWKPRNPWRIQSRRQTRK